MGIEDPGHQILLSQQLLVQIGFPGLKVPKSGSNNTNGATMPIIFVGSLVVQVLIPLGAVGLLSSLSEVVLPQSIDSIHGHQEVNTQNFASFSSSAQFQLHLAFLTRVMPCSTTSPKGLPPLSAFSLYSRHTSLDFIWFKSAHL